MASCGNQYLDKQSDGRCPGYRRMDYFRDSGQGGISEEYHMSSDLMEERASFGKIRGKATCPRPHNLKPARLKPCSLAVGSVLVTSSHSLSPPLSTSENYLVDL